MSIEEEESDDTDVRRPEAAMAAPVAETEATPVMAKRLKQDVVGGLSDEGGAMKSELAGPGKGGSGNVEQGPAPRAWFPETFLFSPLVVTDDAGQAQVSVKVPDRLTTWRVLALAHSRNGSQAGATATFVGTLPAYVDPVVPSFLRAGDAVSVPVQLVNTTDEPIQTTLHVEVQGGTLATQSQAVTVAKQSSTVRYVDVAATRAGELRLMARMGEADMVVRTVEVQHTGKPVQQVQTGTLAAPRNFSITGGPSQGAGQGIARLSVYPGALALLRSELNASVHRGGVAADAFALLLAGKAPELLRSLGDEPDVEALRKLRLTATQKIMKDARVLSIENASLIAEAARSHVGNPVLERLAQRALATIESSQAPDGTCGGQSGWTLQRLLVATADCARAASGVPNVQIRAAGAFERNAKEIADPYTAAAILAARAATGPLAEILRAQVLAAIEERDNGAKVLALPKGVVRADGHTPSVVEATAMAVLALQDVGDAPLADLGATLLASYSPRFGWGDGRTNLVAMEAALVLFKDPMPDVVSISLRKDGDIVAEGSLAQDKVREVLQLSADALDIAGAHEWSITAEPAVPGLGFSLELTHWVPWGKSELLGSELSVELPKNMRVGNAAAISVQAIVPSGTLFEVELALPAGVQLDGASLEALVQSGVLRSYREVDGKVTLLAAALSPAQRFAASVRIIPTLSGRLQSGPATIRVGSSEGYLAPALFVIAPASR